MKRHFISGLIALLPLVITISVVNFLVNLLTKPFLSATAVIGSRFGPLDAHWFPFISKICILMLIALATALIGALARNYIAGKLIALAEFLVCKIPFVSSVYRASRDVIHTLLASKETAFQEVVLIPFPHQETYSLGFLVRKAPTPSSELATDSLVSVFVPTTPNPTTGFILMLKKEQTIATSLSVEDALKYVISCGVIQPNWSGASRGTTGGAQ